MKASLSFFLSLLLAVCQWLPAHHALANEWDIGEHMEEFDACDSVILHYDGKTWNHLFHGFGMWLNDIYGFAPNDIFAVGEQGVILHYDGQSWTKQKSPTTQRLNRIWGSSRKDIYVCGDFGTMLHFNGMEWQKDETTMVDWCRGIWGFDEKHIFVTGNLGKIFR